MFLSSEILTNQNRFDMKPSWLNELNMGGKYGILDSSRHWRRRTDWKMGAMRLLSPS
jgi:hypothetical protein